MEITIILVTVLILSFIKVALGIRWGLFSFDKPKKSNWKESNWKEIKQFQSSTITITGKAKPKTTALSVVINGKTFNTTSDENGNWKIELKNHIPK